MWIETASLEDTRVFPRGGGVGVSNSNYIPFQGPTVRILGEMSHSGNFLSFVDFDVIERRVGL